MIERYSWETIHPIQMLDLGAAQAAQMQAHAKDLSAYRQRKLSAYAAWSRGEMKEFQAKVVADGQACIPTDGFEVPAVRTGKSPIKVKEKK